MRHFAACVACKHMQRISGRRANAGFRGVSCLPAKLYSALSAAAAAVPQETNGVPWLTFEVVVWRKSRPLLLMRLQVLAQAAEEAAAERIMAMKTMGTSIPDTEGAPLQGVLPVQARAHLRLRLPRLRPLLLPPSRLLWAFRTALVPALGLVAAAVAARCRCTCMGMVPWLALASGMDLAMALGLATASRHLEDFPRLGCPPVCLCQCICPCRCICICPLVWPCILACRTASAMATGTGTACLRKCRACILVQALALGLHLGLKERQRLLKPLVLVPVLLM